MTLLAIGHLTRAQLRETHFVYTYRELTFEKH